MALSAELRNLFRLATTRATPADMAVLRPKLAALADQVDRVERSWNEVVAEAEADALGEAAPPEVADAMARLEANDPRALMEVCSAMAAGFFGAIDGEIPAAWQERVAVIVAGTVVATVIANAEDKEAACEAIFPALMMAAQDCGYAKPIGHPGAGTRH